MKGLTILALISERGGGDAPPVIALATALAARGARVTLVCDAATERLVSGTGLATVAVPAELAEGPFFDTWRREMNGAVPTPATPNPLLAWGHASHPYVAKKVRSLRSDLIISSLFCMGLAEALATSLAIPWVFVNPSFYFGAGQRRDWAQDWYGAFVQGLAQHCFWPLSQRAQAVLHATDPAFDFPPASLPAGHHYTGFLLWEPKRDLPALVRQPGAPWVLVTVSTVPMAGELELARAAAGALGDFPVRTLLTLPYETARSEIGPLPANANVAGFVPHGRFLRHCALVIGHAGHGLVSKALLAGVPMVLLPWHREQPGVSARAEALGVAAVVPRERVSRETVHAAVAAVLGQSSYQEQAATWSKRLTLHDPRAVACQLLERL